MIRDLVRAFVIATVLVLLLDAALQLALSAVRGGGEALFWMSARLPDRAAWVVMAAMLYLIVPRMVWAQSVDADSRLSRRHAFRLAGSLLIVVPIASMLAIWIVLIVHIALRGEWDTRVGVFLEPYFYSAAITDTAPWIMAGAVLLTFARHVE